MHIMYLYPSHFPPSSLQVFPNTPPLFPPNFIRFLSLFFSLSLLKKIPTEFI